MLKVNMSIADKMVIEMLIIYFNKTINKVWDDFDNEEQVSLGMVEEGFPSLKKKLDLN